MSEYWSSWTALSQFLLEIGERVKLVLRKIALVSLAIQCDWQLITGEVADAVLKPVIPPECKFLTRKKKTAFQEFEALSYIDVHLQCFQYVGDLANVDGLWEI